MKKQGFSPGPFPAPPQSFPPPLHALTCPFMNERAPQEIRTFFITAVAANRRRLFQTDANANLLLNLLNDDRAKGRYQIHAFVLMPDHIHLLLTPAPDVSIEKAVQFIKGGFSFRLKSKMPVWEDSFTKRRMEDPRDFAAHRDYIHGNPVRAHLAAAPEEFAFSSAHLSRATDPPPHAYRP
jgi:putative transposase